MATKKVEKQYHALRLYTGSDPKADWFNLNDHIGEHDIQQIKDPEGNTAQKEITSIPSPFARLHLFETAFHNVANNAIKDRMSGNTLYHKLVSDALDVGEIFFKYDVFQQSSFIDLEIIQWNKKEALEELSESYDSAHQLLGETLSLFLDQDSEYSNFGDLENLYILTYDHQVVGCTSPTTLFFTTANDLSFVDLKQGNHRLFDKEFEPLHRRSPDYQLYLHKLFEAYPTLKTKMHIFWKYLDKSLECLKTENKELYKEISKIKRGREYSFERFKEEYDEANLGTHGSTIDIFKGVEHRRKQVKQGDAGKNSDFVIASEKYGNKDLMPLALQNNFNKPLQYTAHGKWEAKTQVPYFDAAELDDRYLPDQNEKYPYLTVSDFLEPHLIKVPYPIDDKRFFNGNPEGFNKGNMNEPPEDSYILPLTKRFFEFFDTDYLKSITKKSKYPIKLSKVGKNDVKVELLVPIQNEEYISFERIYKTGIEPNLERNEGAIVENNFNIAVMPHINDKSIEHQRVMLIDADYNEYELAYDYDLTFHINENPAPVSIVKETQRSDKHRTDHNATSKFYVLNSGFDYIQVANGKHQGVVIPQFNPFRRGTKQFTFAVDFGTTNTHIEYSVNQSNPIPFDISEKDTQVVTLSDHQWSEHQVNRPELESLPLNELLPRKIAEDNEYCFPIRTAVSEVEDLDHGKSVIALADANIPFIYEKQKIPENTSITTNLKWQKMNDGDLTNNNRVFAFLETLFILMRNKVLLNGGDLSRTELIWFSPASMSTNQKAKFERMWNELFKKYINDKEPIEYSESVVPFYQHNIMRVSASTYPVVNIDIGGGTTDIVVFEGNKPKFLTSIKFAGNSVFGNAYIHDKGIFNGMARHYMPYVAEILEKNETELYELLQVYRQLTTPDKFNSEDLIAFFFSLENNHTFKKAGTNFSFSTLLADDDDFRIVFVIFYSAIIYHIAKTMKTLGLELPRYICLSGNGSKIIKLLDGSKMEQIADLSASIFEKVYQKPYHNDGLEVVQDRSPKEATCKGGIKLSRKAKNEQGRFDKIILLGDDRNTIINSKKVHYEHNVLSYREMLADDSYIITATVEVMEFFGMLLLNNEKDFKFSEKFDISNNRLRDYYRVLIKDIQQYMKEGLALRRELTEDSENVSETLFFYPIVASLFNLTKHIAENK